MQSPPGTVHLEKLARKMSIDGSVVLLYLSICKKGEGGGKLSVLDEKVSVWGRKS